MKNVSQWTFSAPLTAVDLPRIVDEAGMTRARGVIRVEVDGEFIILAVVEALRLAHAKLPPPAGYLTYVSSMERDYELDPEFTGTTAVSGLEDESVPGSMAVFFPRNRNEADELVGKILDRVTVNVEVF